MQRKIRVMAALLISVAMFFVNASAFDDSNIAVLSNSDAFDLISHTSDLNTSTGLFRYGADVLATSGATSTYVSCVIQRFQGGNYVNEPGSWLSQSKSGNYASVGGQRYVYKGYWYRTQATYIVHINGQEYKYVDNSDQYWYG